jgi:hypothetical protein
MKTTRQSALALTLIMLLLVLGAAFVFLFQQQQTLETALTAAEAEAAALDETREALNTNLVAEQTLLNSTEATRTIAEMALATTQAENILLNGNVVESDQARATLTSENALLNAANGALQATQESLLLQPPQVAILSPLPDDNLLVGDEVAVEIVAADPTGITALNIQINDTNLGEIQIASGTLVTHTERWYPASFGDYLLRVTARNSNGITSQPAEVIISVNMAPAALTAPSQRSVQIDDAERAEIETAVQEIRQVTLTADLTVNPASTTEISAQIDNVMLNPERVAEFAFLLEAMGLIPPNTDLIAAMSARLNTNRFAYFIPRTSTMLLANDVTNEDALKQAYAAEYLHFFQDWAYDLTLNGLGMYTDAALARWALVEGERSYFMQILENDFSWESSAAWSSTEPGAADENIPPAIITYLSFTSVVGEEFVANLIASSDTGTDTSALHEAWRSPPASSEQVLHFEKFLTGEEPQPVEQVDLSETLNGLFTEVARGTLGEWGLRQMLAAPGTSTRQKLSAEQVERMADGWGGDEYTVWYGETDGALLFVLEISWDEVEEGDEFASDFANYASNALPDASLEEISGADCWLGMLVICQQTTSGRTFVVRAPNMSIAMAVLSAYERAE